MLGFALLVGKDTTAAIHLSKWDVTMRSETARRRPASYNRSHIVDKVSVEISSQPSSTLPVRKMDKMTIYNKTLIFNATADRRH